MKHLLLILLMAILATVCNSVFAQHNYNQKKFKAANWKSYEKSKRSLDKGNPDNLFQMEGYSYSGNNVGGIQQYVKDNEMIFEIRSIMNVEASKYLVEFNLTQVGEDASVTNNLMNTRLDSFISKLIKLGVPQQEVYVDMIYLVPTFKFNVSEKLFSKTYNEVPTGFEMQKNVHIVFDDINLVDDMVTIAAECEIYDLVKLDFFVSNTSDVYDSLQNLSVDYLNRKTSVYEKLGVKLKDKSPTIRESSRAIYPETQYNDYDAFVTQSLDAVKRKTVTTIRKPKTVAYDQIAYNEFDIVVNPTILKPMVQYVYTLQVKYVLEDLKKEQKPTYMLVTPNGDVKQLIL